MSSKNPPAAGPNQAVRISRGAHKGRQIKFALTPGLRPTLSRVRESAFDMVHHYAPEYAFVDLFAGSGALGIEAQGVGFHPVFLLERQAEACAAIEKNLDKLALRGKIHLVQTDSMRWLKTQELPSKTVFYADPPFERPDLHHKVLTILARNLPAGGHWLYVAEYENQPPLQFEDYGPTKHKKYGRARLSILELGNP